MTVKILHNFSSHYLFLIFICYRSSYYFAPSNLTYFLLSFMESQFYPFSGMPLNPSIFDPLYLLFFFQWLESSISTEINGTVHTMKSLCLFFCLNSPYTFDKHISLYPEIAVRLNCNLVVYFRKKIDTKQANKSCMYCFQGLGLITLPPMIHWKSSI